MTSHDNNEAERQVAASLFGDIQSQDQRVFFYEDGTTDQQPRRSTPEPESPVTSSITMRKPHGFVPGMRGHKNRRNVRDAFTHQEGMRKLLYLNPDGSTELEWDWP